MKDIKKHIKLSELAKRVEEVIHQSFGNQTFWIVAEVSGHKFYPNQDRHYFEFIEKADGTNDPVAKVRGVSWTTGSNRIKCFEKGTGQEFGNGLQVLVKVRVEFHQTYGFSLVLLDIDEGFTLGEIERLRRETLLRLVAENPLFIELVGGVYNTKNKKIKLNKVLQSIAIIGSPNSAGCEDFLHTLISNQFNYKFAIDIYQSAVQGAEAEKELVHKLIDIFNSKVSYDCVVIIRGGGAKSDFLVFDSYLLSKAIAKFPIPIITGIGHYTDISVADLMANTNTKTPTKAAEFIIAHNRLFEDSVIEFQKAIIIKSQQSLSHALERINSSNILIINKSRNHINHHKDQLTSINQVVINKTKTILYNRQSSLVSLLNLLTSKPKMITNGRVSDLNNLVDNLGVFTTKYLLSQRGYLNHYSSIIKLMSPESILRKGFAIVSQKGKILKSGDPISIGGELTVTMQSYIISTNVISKTKTDGSQTDI